LSKTLTTNTVEEETNKQTKSRAKEVFGKPLSYTKLLRYQNRIFMMV